MNQSRMERERYLSRVVRQCMKELDSIQVPYGHVVEVTVNTRARKRWGLCRKEADGYHISIADRLRDGNTEQGLRDTVMHELLHTCPMCNNHGAMWKHFAEVVNRELSCHIKRTDSNEDKGLPPEDTASQVLHQYHCDGCGQIIRKMRVCKFTRNYRSYTCGICGGHFVQDF